MPHLIDLASLKTELNIKDTDKDVYLRDELAPKVRRIMEAMIGPFELTGKVFYLGANDLGAVLFPNTFKKTFQGITRVDTLDIDGIETGAQWRFDPASYLLHAWPLGEVWPTVDGVQRPLKVSFTSGWESALQAIPQWLKDDWVMFSKEYWQRVIAPQSLVIASMGGAGLLHRPLTIGEFTRQIGQYYHPAQRVTKDVPIYKVDAYLTEESGGAVTPLTLADFTRKYEGSISTSTGATIAAGAHGLNTVIDASVYEGNNKIITNIVINQGTGDVTWSTLTAITGRIVILGF